jgi:hypothetical protein
MRLNTIPGVGGEWPARRIERAASRPHVFEVARLRDPSERSPESRPTPDPLSRLPLDEAAI